MHELLAQMQTVTCKRKYKSIQDSSPEDTFVDGIYCPSDLQELIKDMFPEIADVFCFISDHEAEANRYMNAKKQRSCNAKPTAQPTADMLGNFADSV